MARKTRTTTAPASAPARKPMKGEVVLVVRSIKSPMGRELGERTYALAYPPAMRSAFGKPIIDVERSTVLIWRGDDNVAKVRDEILSAGYTITTMQN